MLRMRRGPARRRRCPCEGVGLDFEERLNRVIEREETEALAQPPELFMASTRESIDRLEQVAEQISKAYGSRMGQLMEAMNRLANIVIVGEERLDEIEGKAS